MGFSFSVTKDKSTELCAIERECYKEIRRTNCYKLMATGAAVCAGQYGEFPYSIRALWHIVLLPYL